MVVIPSDQRQVAPDLSGTTLSGGRFDLVDHLRGHVTLVNVWASWCEPCRREMPTLVQAAAAKGAGLRVVGIDEHDNASSARSFSASVGATYPSLVDTDGRLLSLLPMLPQSAVPSSVFIDARGRVAARVIGPITAQQLAAVLRQLAASS